MRGFQAPPRSMDAAGLAHDRARRAATWSRPSTAQGPPISTTRRAAEDHRADLDHRSSPGPARRAVSGCGPASQAAGCSRSSRQDLLQGRARSGRSPPGRPTLMRRAPSPRPKASMGRTITPWCSSAVGQLPRRCPGSAHEQEVRLAGRDREAERRQLARPAIRARSRLRAARGRRPRASSRRQASAGRLGSACSR